MFTTSLQCSALALTQKGREEEIFRDKLRNIAQYLIYNRTCHLAEQVINSIAIMKRRKQRKFSSVTSPNGRSNWHCQTTLCVNLSHLQSEHNQGQNVQQ